MRLLMILALLLLPLHALGSVASYDVSPVSVEALDDGEDCCDDTAALLDECASCDEGGACDGPGQVPIPAQASSHFLVASPVHCLPRPPPRQTFRIPIDLACR